MEVEAGGEACARATVCRRREEKRAPQRKTQRRMLARGGDMEPKRKRRERNIKLRAT